MKCKGDLAVKPRQALRQLLMQHNALGQHADSATMITSQCAYIKDRELASKYYHSTHVSVSPRITQVAVT